MTAVACPRPIPFCSRVYTNSTSTDTDFYKISTGFYQIHKSISVNDIPAAHFHSPIVLIFNEFYGV